MRLDLPIAEDMQPGRNGWRTGEIDLRLDVNHSQVGHLARIRNTA
jgi:hypothetical protein